MNFDFSLTETPVSSVRVTLRSVYCVYADPSYNVLKSEDWPIKIYIALRTVSGFGKIKLVEKDEITIPPGTIAFFNLNDIRNYYCSSETWDFWWFEFTMDDIVDLPINQMIPIKPFTDEFGECKSCIELLGKVNAGMTRLASAGFSVLLCKWMLQIDSYCNKDPYREMIENVINHMRANLHKPSSIKNLAQVTGFCEHRFRQIFEQITGMTPKKYQDILRVNTAVELLINTPLSIQEISLKLGYSSQFHFSKAFQSTKHMAPSKYRTNAMNQGYNIT